MSLIEHRHFSSSNFFLQNAQLLILAFFLIYWIEAAFAMNKDEVEKTNGIVGQHVDGGENGEEKNGKDKEEEDWTANSNEFHLTRAASVETILKRQKRGGSGSLDRVREKKVRMGSDFAEYRNPNARIPEKSHIGMIEKIKIGRIFYLCFFQIIIRLSFKNESHLIFKKMYFHKTFCVEKSLSL